MLRKINKFFTKARLAKEAVGKGYPAQLMEILQLRKGTGKLGLEEYYIFELYDDDRFTGPQKQEFAGWNAERDWHKLNQRTWHALANDKLAFYSYMRGQGLLIPDIYAVYHHGGRRFDGAPSFADASAFESFLRSGIHYPFFSKPVQGVLGHDAKLVRSFDPKSDELILGNGERQGIGDYVANLSSPGDLGHLFQEVLEPSDSVKAICGNRLSSIRMIVLNDGPKPRLLLAGWKLAVGNNATDNTGDGTNGNIVAGVDNDAGTITRAFTGPIDGKVRFITTHPDTGVELVGRQMPQWDEIYEYTMESARIFPGLKLQAWDILGTQKGIMSLEINLVEHDTAVVNQFANRRGMLAPELVKLLAGGGE